MKSDDITESKPGQMTTLQTGQLHFYNARVFWAAAKWLLTVQVKNIPVPTTVYRVVSRRYY